MEMEERQPGEGDRWLLLVHQLPAKPAYLRVKIWRRLQALGAVAVKNAVHALPAGSEALEDFTWLLREIEEGGGEAMICEARFIEGLSDQQVRTLFEQARDADYQALAEEARALAATLEEAAGDGPPEALAQLKRLRARLVQIVAIDFFGANGREAAEGLLAALEKRLAEQAAGETPTSLPEAAARTQLTGRTWVTRQGVHVDRIASAWLVRRFIDPAASFKFVPAKGYRPAPGELRFDMFDAEFTHEGDRCTFEVLLTHTGLDEDPALRAMAEIVHDIDLKDGKFGRPEADGIKTLIAGLCMAVRRDEERLERGAVLFDDLYGYFRTKRGR